MNDGTKMFFTPRYHNFFKVRICLTLYDMRKSLKEPKFMCQYGAIQGNHICQEEQTLTFTRCTFKGLEKIMSLMLLNLSKNWGIKSEAYIFNIHHWELS